MGSGYLLGREPAGLGGTDNAEMKLFAGELVDGREFVGARFKLCTFANISFKQATIEQSTFDHCVFVDCYFRQADIKASDFIGSRFIRCKFPRIYVSQCNFEYAEFVDCYIDAETFGSNWPSNKHNLRRDLANSLSLAAASLGATADAREFRLAAIEANESDLWQAVTGRQQWYQKHYPRTIDRAQALGRLFLSKLNRWLWGSGERWGVLATNLLLLALVVFPALYFVAGSAFVGSPGFLDLVGHSVVTIVPGNISVSGVEVGGFSASFLTWAEAVVGVVGAGLLVAVVTRAILRR